MRPEAGLPAVEFHGRPAQFAAGRVRLGCAGARIVARSPANMGGIDLELSYGIAGYSTINPARPSG